MGDGFSETTEEVKEQSEVEEKPEVETEAVEETTGVYCDPEAGNGRGNL